MRIIARRTLREYVERRRGYKDQPALKAALDAWFDEVKKARWTGAADVKRSYATASIISADRVVFNVKGNTYRLVAAVDFEKGIVWIKWIGTHRDYDKIDVKEVQHTPSAAPPVHAAMRLTMPAASRRSFSRSRPGMAPFSTTMRPPTMRALRSAAPAPVTGPARVSCRPK